MKEGDVVRLNTPDNLRLHMAQGVVKTITPWGAFVNTPAAATGEYRALAAEMVPYAQVNGPARVQAQAKDQGYTGEMCNTCGGVRLRRNGPCLLCEDCGSTTGCS
jgi:hypothetical protein